MSYRRASDGYLMIDHRESPGLPALEQRTGLPVGAGRILETATYKCWHCQRIVVVNPLRVRERAHCSACDHDICDDCGTRQKLTGTCENYVRRRDEYLERVIKHGT